MILQKFYLSRQLVEIIEKSEEPQNAQLKIEQAIEFLQEESKLSFIQTELNNIEDIAQKILKQYNKAIIIGIGGAIVASRGFVASRNYSSVDFSLFYSDSLSAIKQATIFTKENLRTAALIIISRSGASIETLGQAQMAVSKYKEYFGVDYPLGKHFFIVTQGSNRLSRLGKNIDAQMVEYTNNGGKFASLSLVGLLPARLINLSPQEIIAGAIEALNNPLEAIKAAKINYHLLKQGYSINIFTYYNDLLDQLSNWYIQVSSEVVAKEGKGFTPLSAKGVFDQHGLWQLFLAGPRDKYFTFLKDAANTEEIELVYYQLSLKRLKRQAIPVREIVIDSLSPKNLGELSMQLLLELVLLAKFLGVSPLTQPCIDQNKRLLYRLFFSKIVQ